MAPILRNGGSQSPDRWLREPRNNQAIHDIRHIDPLAKRIYVCPRTQDGSVQLDIDAPYYEITDLGLIPTDKYETGSHHRWYYWSIDAN